MRVACGEASWEVPFVVGPESIQWRISKAMKRPHNSRQYHLIHREDLVDIMYELKRSMLTGVSADGKTDEKWTQKFITGLEPLLRTKNNRFKVWP